MTLRLVDASYRYAGTSRPVLDGLSLTVEAGTVTGVVGPNEAGKSTLCLVSSGLAPASISGRLEGSVTLDGVETVTLRPHELAQRCGVLFQNPTTQLSGTAVTVFEEVAFGPRNLGLGVPEIVERVRWALETLGIESLAPRSPDRLSGGQAQLVALASVLALRPPYLVLDEPTSQLDPQGTRQVGEALARLAGETGTAILIVEHKTELLARMTRRVAVIDAGRIVREGPTAEVLGDPDLPGLGVDPPAAVRLRRALASDGARWERVSAAIEAVGEWDGTALAAGSLIDSGSGARVGSGMPAGSDAPAAGAAPAQSAAPRRVSIRVESVVFDYPDGTRALRCVDLSVEPGERLAVIGQNGSGKSTLVRQLNGLLRPTEGRVLLDGRDARSLHVAQLAAIVGLAFQNPDRQIFAGRVRTEVAFGPRNLGLRDEALDATIRDALDAVGLANEIDGHPYDLGYSRRKLLSLASVLAMRTPVVVLDEPTTGQDARGVERVREIVARLSAEGRTVIAISHDMRFVAETFDRVVVMRAGEIILDGAADEVFAARHWPELASTYLEPPLAARVGDRLGLGRTPTERRLAEAVQATG